MAEQLESFFGVLKRQRRLRQAEKNAPRPHCPAMAWVSPTAPHAPVAEAK